VLSVGEIQQLYKHQKISDFNKRKDGFVEVGMGVPKGSAYKWGNTWKSYWRISNSPKGSEVYQHIIKF